ncbi:MAG: amino acid dehydrogenase [Planctomycetes bacterium]|nr:amino acid dehydrogenase [Planctomycetota bacterium]
MDASLIDAVLGEAEFEQIEILREPEIGLSAVVAIHHTRLGPAFGGVRCHPYSGLGPALADALRLARHMSLKCAIHEIPGGGGKVALCVTPGMDRGAVYRRLGDYIEQLGGRFYTGPDTGTQEADLLALGERTRFVARPDAHGPGSIAEATALGVFAGIEAVARELDQGIAGLRVMLQGLGAVGWPLGERLAAAGAELTVSDLDQRRLERAADEWGAELLAHDVPAPTVSCDVFAPCALGGVVSDDTLPLLGASAIAGSANNVLADARCGRELHRRGILFAPDFVINSGGLLFGALFHLEGASPPPERIAAIGDLLARVFFEATVQDAPPEQVAEALAAQRLQAAKAPPFFPQRDAVP